MKNKIVKIFVLFSVLGLFLIGAKVSADEEVIPTPTEEVEVTPSPLPTPTEEVEDEPVVEYNAFVTILSCENGVVKTNITEGMAGDTVEIYYTPSLLCSLKSLTFNGEMIEATSLAYFKATLVEGENVIKATFELDNEQLAYVSKLLNSAKDGDWASIFTVDNLLKVIYTVITLFFSGGYFLFLKKYKSLENLTLENVQTTLLTTVVNKVDALVPEAIREQTTGVLGPTIQKLSEQAVANDKSNTLMIECMILMQANTDSARLAMLEKLSQVDTNTNLGLSKEIKAILEASLKKQQEEAAAKKKAIEELEKEINTVEEIETESNSNEVEHL